MMKAHSLLLLPVIALGLLSPTGAEAQRTMNEVMSLTIDADAVRLVGGAAGADGQVIAPGIAALVAGDLGRPASLAWRIEAAIATIEDVLATVPSGLHHAAVSSRAPPPRVKSPRLLLGSGRLPLPEASNSVARDGEML